jgi:regulator of cell morphogenesis and NO signaling
MAELKAFERDLHHHVHLENNILFPKAIALENGSWRDRR